MRILRASLIFAGVALLAAPDDADAQVYQTYPAPYPVPAPYPAAPSTTVVVPAPYTGAPLYPGYGVASPYGAAGQSRRVARRTSRRVSRRW